MTFPAVEQCGPRKAARELCVNRKRGLLASGFCGAGFLLRIGFSQGLSLAPGLTREMTARLTTDQSPPLDLSSSYRVGPFP